MTTPTFDPGFSTEAMAAVLAPAARVEAICRFEAALAAASADHGVVPREIAERIVAACTDPVHDPGTVLAEGWARGTPVMPLLERLRARLDDEAARWLHHGATTQDVVDTALMLQLSEALAALRVDLVRVAHALRSIAVGHRDTPAAAWTFLQPAVPTTVGRRAAGWLQPVVTHLAQLRVLQAGLPLQLGGAAGTLDGFGDDGIGIVASVAERLGLVATTLPWHTDRTPITTVVAALERVARTMAKVGIDIGLLAHDGAATTRAGGSTSMPGKRNPIDAIRAIAAAEACSGAASIVLRGKPHELERGLGGWHAEWLAVPLVLHTVAAAVEATADAVGSLEIIESSGTPTDGPTPGIAAMVDRVVADCDEELSR